MNTSINAVKTWLNHRPKARQWAWFAVLWLAGLLTVLAVAYPIKWIIKNM
jgi:hypothetical protein